MHDTQESTSNPITLEENLRFATSLAEALRQIQRDGGVCGRLDRQHVVWDGTAARIVTDDAPASAAYLAPEQVRGEAPDHRSDIFAFGAILYERLAGHRAFPADDPEELKRQILESTPVPVAGIPEGISALLNGCLEKNRDLRWQRMNSILIELKLAGASARQASSASEWKDKVLSLRSQIAGHDERLTAHESAHESVAAELRDTIRRLEERLESQGSELTRCAQALAAMEDAMAVLQKGAQVHSKAIEGLHVAAAQTDEVVEHVVEAFGMMHKSMVERGEAKVLLGARNGS